MWLTLPAHCHPAVSRSRNLSSRLLVRLKSQGGCGRAGRQGSHRMTAAALLPIARVMQVVATITDRDGSGSLDLKIDDFTRNPKNGLFAAGAASTAAFLPDATVHRWGSGD